MAIKLDISEAFDKVEWKLLDSVMRQMGFSDIHMYIICYLFSIV